MDAAEQPKQELVELLPAPSPPPPETDSEGGPSAILEDPEVGIEIFFGILVLKRQG